MEDVFYHLDAAFSKSILLGLLSNIKPPVSVTIASQLKKGCVTPSAIQDAKVVTGKDVEGNWQGTSLQVGNAEWLILKAHPLVESWVLKGFTVTCHTVDGVVTTIHGFQDTLRVDAATTVSELQRRDIAVHILSGDNYRAVQSVASQLAILIHKVRSRYQPADKRSYVEYFQAQPQAYSRRAHPSSCS